MGGDAMDEPGIMYQDPKPAPNERKPREALPVGPQERQHCHRTRGGRGVVARLFRRRRLNPLQGGR